MKNDLNISIREICLNEKEVNRLIFTFFSSISSKSSFWKIQNLNFNSLVTFDNLNTNNNVVYFWIFKQNKIIIASRDN